MTETTNTATTLHAYLSYPDAPAAQDWLVRAFGFEVHTSFADDDGHVVHSELTFGDGAIVVFSDTEGYDRPAPKGPTVGSGLYFAVPDEAAVDRAFAGAVEAGGTPVWTPEQSEWNYRCRVRDPQGREWTFGTHRPGAPYAG